MASHVTWNKGQHPSLSYKSTCDPTFHYFSAFLLLSLLLNNHTDVFPFPKLLALRQFLFCCLDHLPPQPPNLSTWFSDLLQIFNEISRSQWELQWLPNLKAQIAPLSPILTFSPALFFSPRQLPSYNLLYISFIFFSFIISLLGMKTHRVFCPFVILSFTIYTAQTTTLGP